MKLSPRERQILELIVVGTSTKEIAFALGITPRTVETHRGHIKDKFGITTHGDGPIVAYVLGKEIERLRAALARYELPGVTP